MSSRLVLEPGPASVRGARQWVSAALRDLGRDDLVDSAALGLPELVTNAILHADLLGGFERQAGVEPALPWLGSLTLDPPRP